MTSNANEDSRVKKSLLNAKVNTFFFTLSLAISFWSRKVFLDTLGVDFFGLISTIQGFIGFLSLVELGIGSSIGFALFKPLFNKDHKAINEIVSVLGFLYYIVGGIILTAGVTISLFFPIIFEKEGISLTLVYFAFFTFLISTLLSYFVNYRQSLLGADQRYYIVNVYTQSFNVLCTIVQIVVAYYTSNPYCWLGIYLTSQIVSSIILNWKIRQQYPWLRANIRLGKQKYKDYPEIMKKTKQLFIHKMAGFAQNRIQPALMYAFSPLRMVGMYDNYSMVIQKSSSVVDVVLGGSQASVGNLIAEGKKERILSVFWELFSIRFWAAGIFAFCFWYLTDPFITLWLGAQYVMEKNILLLIIAGAVIYQLRTTTDFFIQGFGLFHDVWAPITEAIMSVSISIVCGYFWGIAGVLTGPIVSMMIIVGVWKPYFLFSRGMEKSVMMYWWNFFRYAVSFVISFAIASNLVVSNLSINPASGFINWVLYAAIITVSYSVILLFIMYMLTAGTKDIVNRFKEMIASKLRFNK